MNAIGLSEIATGVEPAHRARKIARVTRGVGHDVSILIGVGRQLGEPRVFDFGKELCVPKTSSECDAAVESPKLAG